MLASVVSKRPPQSPSATAPPEGEQSHAGRGNTILLPRARGRCRLRPTPRLKPTRPNGPAQPSLRAKREATLRRPRSGKRGVARRAIPSAQAAATLRRPRSGKRGVARRAIPSAQKANTPAAEVGFRGGGEGMWPPLRRPGEREIATEAGSRRGSPLRRQRGVGSACPCVADQLRGSVHSSTVSNLNRIPLPSRGPDRTTSESRPSGRNPVERWASRPGPGIEDRHRRSATGLGHPSPTGSRLSCSPWSCRS